MQKPIICILALFVSCCQAANAQNARRHQLSLGASMYLTQGYRNYGEVVTENSTFEPVSGLNPVFCLDYRYNAERRLQILGSVFMLNYTPRIGVKLFSEDGRAFNTKSRSNVFTTWFLGLEAGVAYRLPVGKKMQLGGALHAALLGSGTQEPNLGNEAIFNSNGDVLQSYDINVINNPDQRIFIGARPQIELERSLGNRFFTALRMSYLWVPGDAARGNFTFTDNVENITYSGPLSGSLSGFMLGVHFGTRF